MVKGPQRDPALICPELGSCWHKRDVSTVLRIINLQVPYSRTNGREEPGAGRHLEGWGNGPGKNEMNKEVVRDRAEQKSGGGIQVGGHADLSLY